MLLVLMLTILINFGNGMNESKNEKKGIFHAGESSMSNNNNNNDDDDTNYCKAQMESFYHNLLLKDNEFFQFCTFVEKIEADSSSRKDKNAHTFDEPSTNTTNNARADQMLFATNSEEHHHHQTLMEEGAVAENYGDQFLTDSEVKIQEKMPKNERVSRGNRAGKTKALKSVNDLANFVQRVDQMIERFVGYSNKNWHTIKHQLEVMAKQASEEKQKALAFECQFDGFENVYSKIGRIEVEAMSNRSALILAGKVADKAVFGIGILFFMLGVELEFGRTNLNHFVMTKTRWIACKLVQLKPINEMFKNHLAIIRARLNTKCKNNAAYATICVDTVTAFLDEAKLQSDNADKSGQRKQLLNIFICLRFFRQIDEMCQQFYGNAFLIKLPALNNLLYGIRFLIHQMALQFAQFVKIALSHGFEVMKQQICQ